MTIDVEDLAKHLGFAVTPADTESLERVLGASRAMILPYLLEPLPSDPDRIAALDVAILTVAQDLWRRKDSYGGTFAFADADQIGVLPRDQLRSVWPILAEAGLVAPVVVA